MITAKKARELTDKACRLEEARRKKEAALDKKEKEDAAIELRGILKVVLEGLESSIRESASKGRYELDIQYDEWLATADVERVNKLLKLIAPQHGYPSLPTGTHGVSDSRSQYILSNWSLMVPIGGYLFSFSEDFFVELSWGDSSKNYPEDPALAWVETPAPANPLYKDLMSIVRTS